MVRKLLAASAFTIAIGAAVEAPADQCAWVTEAQALDAATHLRRGTRMREFCEPCNERAPSPAKTVQRIEVRPVPNEPRYWQLVVDTKAVDLAYVFVESPQEPGRFDNLAKLAGCPTIEVSASIRGR